MKGVHVTLICVVIGLMSATIGFLVGRANPANIITSGPLTSHNVDPVTGQIRFAGPNGWETQDQQLARLKSEMKKIADMTDQAYKANPVKPPQQADTP